MLRCGHNDGHGQATLSAALSAQASVVLPVFAYLSPSEFHHGASVADWWRFHDRGLLSGASAVIHTCATMSVSHSERHEEIYELLACDLETRSGTRRGAVSVSCRTSPLCFRTETHRITWACLLRRPASQWWRLGRRWAGTSGPPTCHPTTRSLP